MKRKYFFEYLMFIPFGYLFQLETFSSFQEPNRIVASGIIVLPFTLYLWYCIALNFAMHAQNVDNQPKCTYNVWSVIIG